MSIKLYTGLQGSGKSYEVVSVVILGALRDGRRVVSNVAGLQYDKMREFLIADGVDPEVIGTILQVQHEDIEKDNFFRCDTDTERGIETIVQGGDVLVLDEIWRFWDSDRSVTARQQNFMRMHRHMLHPESGMSCEIVLISQSHMDVCKKIRNVVEKTYLMTKHTEMGTDKFYRVQIYSRADVSRRTVPIQTLQKKYDPRFFELYKSHSAGGEVVDPKEKSVDRRGSLFSRSIFKFGLPIVFVLAIPSFLFVWHLLHPKPEDVAAKLGGSAAAPVSFGSSAPGVAAAGPAPAPRPGQPPVSTSWRVVGYYSSGSSTTFVVSDGVTVRALMNPPNFKVFAMGSTVELPEGGFATSWNHVGQKKEGVL